MKRIQTRLGLIFRAWPIRPVPVATITTAFIVMVVSAVVVTLNEESGLGLQGQNLGWILSMFGLFFSMGLGVLSLGAALTKRLPRATALIYNFTGVSLGVVAVLVRMLIASDETPAYWNEPISQVRLFVIMLLLFYVLHISLGVASYRISQQAQAATAAKNELEVQRGKLIETQEQTRRQIADFLHDRLQSDLVVLGMQLNQLTESLDPAPKKIAKAFVDEIERIRQVDVRQASRALAPELDGPSVLPALNDLIKQYESVMKISLRLEQEHPIAKQQRLAVYRILEQTLLNAAGHAAATLVLIKIVIGIDEVSIEIDNDGLPLPEQYVPGSGFAIIDNWVQLNRGSWKILQDEEKTHFEAKLRL